jgi:hypothetical protein
VTTLPDWLVERAALDEVPPASRERIDRADKRELDERIAALHADNERELASHPAGPAVAQIEARAASEAKKQQLARRRSRLQLVTAVGAVAAIVLVAGLVLRPSPMSVKPELPDGPEVTTAKGGKQLTVYRQAGDRIELLVPDAVVRAGDVLQLRYRGGGEKYGVIASIDGAGAVTLHFPASEDAPPEATALAPKATALPNAYALDDAPRFERFFFFTAKTPIDVSQSLAALRAFAQRSDGDTATPEMPAGLEQTSVRLRKPDSKANP